MNEALMTIKELIDQYEEGLRTDKETLMLIIDEALRAEEQ